MSVMQNITNALRAAGGDRPPLVPVLRLTGTIGGGGGLRGGLSLAALAAPIARAFQMRGAKAIALAINSPGGAPVQSELIMQRIRALADEKHIPVFAFAEDVMASGGYLLALAADEIFAAPTSMVGSIGVISSSFGFTELIEKLGIERRVHTAGESKSLLDPFRPEREEDLAKLHRMQDVIHAHFKDLVSERRGQRLNGTAAELFTGDIWVGQEAVDNGLIDGIGDLRTIMRERFGEKVKLKPVGVSRGWFRRRLQMRSVSELTGGGDPGMAIANSLLNAIEERSLWSRFGL